MIFMERLDLRRMNLLRNNSTQLSVITAQAVNGATHPKTESEEILRFFINLMGGGAPKEEDFYFFSPSGAAWISKFH